MVWGRGGTFFFFVAVCCVCLFTFILCSSFVYLSVVCRVHFCQFCALIPAGPGSVKDQIKLINEKFAGAAGPQWQGSETYPLSRHPRDTPSHPWPTCQTGVCLSEGDEPVRHQLVISDSDGGNIYCLNQVHVIFGLYLDACVFALKPFTIRPLTALYCWDKARKEASWRLLWNIEQLCRVLPSHVSAC